jgi:hypothetical protein
MCRKLGKMEIFPTSLGSTFIYWMFPTIYMEEIQFTHEYISQDEEILIASDVYRLLLIVTIAVSILVE